MPKRALSSSWITTYYETIAKISEAPNQFNIWAAISVVSSVLKNHVYFSRGVYTIYPNQYIILVGPPGVGKGTAIHPAYDFPIDLGLVNAVSDRNTAPRILEKLAAGFISMAPGQSVLPPVANTQQQIPQALKEAAAVIKASELQTLLGSSDWMTTFLCETWDRKDFEYDTKHAGTSIVKNMCVSLIGACVPAYIQSLSKETASAINGGFTARAVFVYANEKSKNIEWPKSFKELQGGIDLHKKLEDDLRAISNLRGEFSISAHAKNVFQDFYRSKSVTHSDSDSDVMQHFKSRIHVHAFKVAMALSAAFSDSLEISLQDMQVAITLVKQVQNNLDRAFRGFGTSQLAEVTSRIQQFIEQRGVTTRKEILTYNHRYISDEDLTRVLFLLQQIDFIKVTSSGGTTQIQYNKQAGAVVSTSAITDLYGNQTGGKSGNP
ncbi:MAG TPA: DUF3987 domain-containing protein [Candidatus Saccharimonadales bacterium]|jgi:hypothetical protein